MTATTVGTMIELAGTILKLPLLSSRLIGEHFTCADQSCMSTFRLHTGFNNNIINNYYHYLRNTKLGDPVRLKARCCSIDATSIYQTKLANTWYPKQLGDGFVHHIEFRALLRGHNLTLFLYSFIYMQALSQRKTFYLVKNLHLRSGQCVVKRVSSQEV